MTAATNSVLPTQEYTVNVNNNGVQTYNISGQDRDGRVLGEIYVEDKEGKQYNINKTLISEGHAYVYDGGKKKVYTY